MVERRFPKPDAVGSSPTGRAAFFAVKILKKKKLNMIRIKRGLVARKRKKKILKTEKGFQTSSKNRFRTANQKNLKAKYSAYKNRKKRKIFFRDLWINRINSSTRLNGLNFSRFINFCKKSKIQLNRKILSQLMIYDSESFFTYFQIKNY